jgi:ubiquinone/menaquinone biosynthesis C-methylase UbiE
MSTKISRLSTNSILVGQAYGGAEVEAVDLNGSALDASERSAPNVRLIIDDVEKPWLYEKDSLDFVHMSFLLHSIKNRLNLFEQAWK